MNYGEFMNDDTYIPQLLSKVEDTDLKERLDHELSTYATRAAFYKKVYYGLTFGTIILPSAISVVNAFFVNTVDLQSILTALFSSLTAIMAGILGAANVKDNWINYREHCESLKIEVYKFITHSDPYNTGTSEEQKSLFEKNVIKMYKGETKSWKKQQTKNR